MHLLWCRMRRRVRRSPSHGTDEFAEYHDAPTTPDIYEFVNDYRR